MSLCLYICLYVCSFFCLIACLPVSLFVHCFAPMNILSLSMLKTEQLLEKVKKNMTFWLYEILHFSVHLTYLHEDAADTTLFFSGNQIWYSTLFIFNLNFIDPIANKVGLYLKYFNFDLWIFWKHWIRFFWRMGSGSFKSAPGSATLMYYWPCSWE